MKTKSIFTIFLFSAAFYAGPVLGAETEIEAAPHKNRPPNILLITCDNLGYGDLPCFNPASSVKAPNLDRLASQGARLTSFYTASPTCTCSRACLLTGRIAARHGLDYQLPGVEGNYGVGLNHNEKLISQFLKQAPVPYATGCFGKWNIGFAEGSRPTERGFDEFVGHASGNMDYYRHNYRDRHDLHEGIEELHREGEYASTLLADAAVDFIQRHSEAGRPWFCYLPFNAPHFPVAGNKRPGEPNVWQAPDWAFAAIGCTPEETDPRKRYEAVVFALDRAIGQVLDAVDAAGHSDNTFVFFMSDNGAFRLDREGLDVGINDPLRSGGVTCWEGGLRVAAMARWPDRIPAGSVIDEPFWSPDLLIACAKLAGAGLPENIVFDGKNPLPVLTAGAPSPHESLYFVFRNHAALRKGDWKIVRECPDCAWQLFNVAKDLSESDDLATRRPERLRELTDAFAAWDESVSQQESPGRKDLLQIHGADGHRKAITTQREWERRRRQILEAVQLVMGELPGDERRGPLDIEVIEDVDVGTYRRRLITYQSEPGCRTPAYLCIPKAALAGERKAPAVLCLHPTDNRVGHKVVVGLGGREGRAYAAELAERGYVTLAPAYPQLANYQPDVLGLGYASGSMKAIWDNMRALDLLSTLPPVDASRGFAAIGHSLGGHNSIYTAVFDPRIRVVVTSCGFDSYQDYYDGDDANWQPGRGWCQVRYMPRMADYRGRLDEIPFDFPELLAALAPRPVYINAPVNDNNFRAASVDRCVAGARKVYELLDAEGEIIVRHPDCGHNFPKSLREESYRLIDSVLMPVEQP